MIEALTQFFAGLSAEEARASMQPLFIFVLGMAIYSIFIYKYYKFISRRRIFVLKRGDSIPWKIAYYLEYIFLFPVIAFGWFFVMSMLLAILSTVISIGNIFMVSMATIATIRISAYYSEDLAQEISKLVPFALLAVFLLDITVITPEKPLEVLLMLPPYAETLLYYFVFIVFVEFFLKTLHHIWDPDRRR